MNQEKAEKHKTISVAMTQDEHRRIKVLAAHAGLSFKDIFWIGVAQVEKKEARKAAKEGKP